MTLNCFRKREDEKERVITQSIAINSQLRAIQSAGSVEELDTRMIILDKMRENAIEAQDTSGVNDTTKAINALLDRKLVLREDALRENVFEGLNAFDLNDGQASVFLKETIDSELEWHASNGNDNAAETTA